MQNPLKGDSRRRRAHEGIGWTRPSKAWRGKRAERREDVPKLVGSHGAACISKEKNEALYVDSGHRGSIAAAHQNREKSLSYAQRKITAGPAMVLESLVREMIDVSFGSSHGKAEKTYVGAASDFVIMTKVRPCCPSLGTRETPLLICGHCLSSQSDFEWKMETDVDLGSGPG